MNKNNEYSWKQEDKNAVDWEIVPLDSNDFEVKFNTDSVESKDAWKFDEDDGALEFDDGDFSIDFNIQLVESSPSPRCEFNSTTNHFVMYNEEGQMLVDVNLDDGTVIFGEDYCPNEAAKVFWETIGQAKQQSVNEAWNEYEALNKTEDDDKIKSFDDSLKGLIDG